MTMKELNIAAGRVVMADYVSPDKNAPIEEFLAISTAIVAALTLTYLSLDVTYPDAE